MTETSCPTCTDVEGEQSQDGGTGEHIYLFVSQRGTEAVHFLVEASNSGEARDKLDSRFEGFEDAECLGTPKGVMDLHRPEVVML